MGLEVSTGATQQSQQLSMPSIVDTMKSNGAAAEKIVAEIAPILSAAGNVTVTHAGPAKGPASVRGKDATVSVSVPELDEPYGSAGTVDLTALLAYLQLENDEEQLQVQKTRIEAMKGGIEADHLSSQQSIENSIDEAAEAEEANKRNQILQAILTAVSVIVTIVAGVLTGGTASMAISLVMTAAMMVMDKSGANEAIIDKIAEGLEKLGLDSQASEIIATVVLYLVEMAAMLLTTIKGGGALDKKLGHTPKNSVIGKKFGEATAAKVCKKLAKATLGVTFATQLINTSATVYGAVKTADAEEASAAVKEAQAYLREFQERLDEENEQLQAIVQKMNDDLAALADVLGAQADCNAAIASHING